MRPVLVTLVLALVAPTLGAEAARPTDLSAVVPEISASPALVGDGEPVVFWLNVVADGLPEGKRFDVLFLVDGLPIGTTQAETGWFPIVPVASPPWTATLGLHQLSAVLDPADRIPESDETNNIVVDETPFEVYPGFVDLHIERVALEKSSLPGGSVEHPARAHRIAYEVCNSGDVDSDGATLWIAATPEAGLLPGGERALLPPVDLPTVPVGGCVDGSVPWDASDFVGDVRIDASVAGYPERHLTNNEATTGDAVLVAGFGGARLGLP